MTVAKRCYYHVFCCSMMDGVAKHCQQCEPPEDGYWEAGRVCCAVFSEDETWYRGLITDIGCREAAVSKCAACLYLLLLLACISHCCLLVCITIFP